MPAEGLDHLIVTRPHYPRKNCLKTKCEPHSKFQLTHRNNKKSQGRFIPRLFFLHSMKSYTLFLASALVGLPLFLGGADTRFSWASNWTATCLSFVSTQLSTSPTCHANRRPNLIGGGTASHCFRARCPYMEAMVFPKIADISSML